MWGGVSAARCAYSDQPFLVEELKIYAVDVEMNRSHRCEFRPALSRPSSVDPKTRAVMSQTVCRPLPASLCPSSLCVVLEALLEKPPVSFLEKLYL